MTMIQAAEQRTEEWHELRRGRFTASEIHRLMGMKGLNKGGETYVWEKVAETLGAEMPEVKTYAMERGIELEPEAKQYYSTAYIVTIEEQPFIVAPWCNDAGCSPDGIVTYKSKVGIVQYGIEIKCPINPVNQLRRFRYKNQASLASEEPDIYWQCMMCMAVTEFPSWDFISYYPGLSESYKMRVLTIFRDDVEIKLLKQRINEAVEMKRKILQEIQR